MEVTNAETFDNLVKARANKRVQERIKGFRRDVKDAAIRHGFIDPHTYFPPINATEMSAMLQARSKEELSEVLPKALGHAR